MVCDLNLDGNRTLIHSLHEESIALMLCFAVCVDFETGLISRKKFSMISFSGAVNNTLI
jgi:hypothetical protein